ncbi:MAG: 50S ribosomal protein L23 [Clostridia bacterium]|nr:50S ribosomal protein L23 [Clostridia bacterium]
MLEAREIIKKPLVSEKSMGLMAENKYTFVVDKRANKIQIKNAVQDIFKVTVLDVKTMIVKGKVKRMGKYQGKTPDKKKAIVTLKQGDKIEIFEGL